MAAALGECVHVAGVINFLRLAEMAGWRTVFLGPAVSSWGVIAAARREQATLVAVSYRLMPESGAHAYWTSLPQLPANCAPPVCVLFSAELRR